MTRPVLTSNLKVRFLGISPLLKDRSGILYPQEILALSALLTFRGQSIRKILKDVIKKDGNLKNLVTSTLQKSSLIGHASMSTTPSLCLNYEGSKFLDWALTGLIFSSSLVSSGRRTDTTEKDIIYPPGIYKNGRAKNIYYQVSKENIKIYNNLLSKGIGKDEARKILHQGIYGTGIIQLPIESIIAVKREYEAEKDWMPEEVGILLQKIEESLKGFGVDLLYATRQISPRNNYPYPNVFKNPARPNIVRELINKEKLTEGTKIISTDILITAGLKERLTDFWEKCENNFRSLTQIKKEWFNLLTLQQKILRDYNSALRFKVLSSVPMCIWTEKKRHRTVPMIVESIYFCIEKAAKTFRKFKKQIEKKRINKRLITKIEEIFSIPPSVKKNQEFLLKYLSVALGAFDGYKKLIDLGIKPKEAIFLIPRAVKIDVLQDYDLYNLLAGYYPLRLCATADEEIRRNTIKEADMIQKILREKGYGWLNKFIGPKCEIVGFCPEEKCCFYIKKSVKQYDQQFHKEMKEILKNKFAENLKKLGK